MVSYDIEQRSSRTLYNYRCVNKSYLGVSLLAGTEQFVTGVYRKYPLPDTAANFYTHRIRVLNIDGTDEQELNIR